MQGLDAPGNPVALGATGLPPGASFIDAGDGTGHFAWTPEVSQAGRYRLAFDGESVGGDTDVVYTRLDAIPDFDDFDHPISFTTLPFMSEVFEPEASVAADDPTCPSPSSGPPPGPPPGPDQGSVWYAYTTVEDGGIQVGVQRDSPNGPPTSPGGVGVSVYTGERGALEPRACGRTVVRFPAVAGRTYHIKIDLAPATQFRLSAEALPPPPANDDFAAATVVGTLHFSDALDTRGAMTQPEEPRHCGQASQPPFIGPGYGGSGPLGSLFSVVTNVWYAYTPSEDTRVTVDTSGSNYSYAQMTAFSGARDALVPLGCDPTRLSFTATAGRTYHVMIAGSPFYEPQSSFGDRLQVSVTGMPALHIQAAVDAVGAFDPRTGTAIIHGTARCSRPARIVVDGLLQQERRHVRGDFETVVVCDGATPWRAEVTPDASGIGPRRFAGGPAGVAFHAVGVPDDNPDDAAVDNARASISLKGGPPR